MAMQESPPRFQRALPWCGEDREERRQPCFMCRLPHSAFRIPHSAFRIPHSAFRIPHSAFRIPHSAFRIPHFAFRISPSAFRLPHSAFLLNGDEGEAEPAVEAPADRVGVEPVR